jgi:hypothetical protein
MVNGNVCENFEAVLNGLLAAHEELLALAGEQRHAMASADAAAMESCLRRQGVLAQRISALENHRRTLVRALAGSAEGVQVAQLARSFPEPARGRVAAAAGRLREVLNALQEQNRVLRSAAGSLAAHMDGLMQQVARTIGEAGGMSAGTYGRQGRVQTGAFACALDMSH